MCNPVLFSRVCASHKVLIIGSAHLYVARAATGIARGLDLVTHEEDVAEVGGQQWLVTQRLDERVQRGEQP